MAAFVQARGLVKRFGAFVAVDGIDLDVTAGECFGLLGPNGAGKTSTIRMITCVSPLSDGALTVDGLDVRRDGRRIKARIGVVPQDDNLDSELTVEENLHAYGRYFGLPKPIREARVVENLTLLQLDDRRGSRIDELSGGMKRRLIIARALMNDPRMLVLDEPTTGLDPQARHVVWQKLRLLRQRGITLLLTTHYMDEAARLCDRIAVMDRGRIVAQGTPAELVARHAGGHVVEVRAEPETHDGIIVRLAGGGGFEIEASGDTLYVFGNDGADPRSLVGELESAGDVLTRPAHLEDVFLRLTGRTLQE